MRRTLALLMAVGMHKGLLTTTVGRSLAHAPSTLVMARCAALGCSRVFDALDAGGDGDEARHVPRHRVQALDRTTPLVSLRAT